MPRDYSRRGCLTCYHRKKKCDEAAPNCGACTRLGFRCVKRTEYGNGTPTAFKATNRKMRLPPLRSPISDGYPAFESEFERHLVSESASVLNHLLSPLTRAAFEDMALFSRFYAQSRLVREGIMAFSAYGRDSRGGDSYKVSLKCYQSCIVKLRQSSVCKTDSVEADYALTAILFLGLLEALTLGDTSNALVHFEMCKKLLISRLARPHIVGDHGLMKLYRVAAECIMYNIGALSTFHSNIESVVTDWGTAFDCLFSTRDYDCSPFLDGFSEIYQVMLQVNMLLYRTQRAGLDDTSMATFHTLKQRLDQLEDRIPTMYSQKHDETGLADLARAKNTITVLSLQIHLAKIARPEARPHDRDIQHHVQKAVNILKHKGLQKPRNIDLRWPLTVFACAAADDDTFRFLTGWMWDMERIVDLANSQKLVTALNAIQATRGRAIEGTSEAHDPTSGPFDLLLDPSTLDDVDATSLSTARRSIAASHCDTSIPWGAVSCKVSDLGS